MVRRQGGVGPFDRSRVDSRLGTACRDGSAAGLQPSNRDIKDRRRSRERELKDISESLAYPAQGRALSAREVRAQEVHPLRH